MLQQGAIQPEHDRPAATAAKTEASALTVCICTMDRPAILQRCLDSIAVAFCNGIEVIVSDDSKRPEENRRVCAAFPFVTYIAGPRQGLCANRNKVIARASTPYVSLLDDDAVMSVNFLRLALAMVPQLGTKTLVTGTVIEWDDTIIPNNPTFWGHFGRKPTGRFENINLNCNIFPRAAFEHAFFDETIFYGYEDMDLCSCLLTKGFSIKYDPILVNRHLPPKRDRATDTQRFVKSELARYYTSVKRYLIWERAPLKLAAYLLLAPLHRAAHAVKAGMWQDLGRCWPDLILAVRMTLREKARLAAP